MELDSLEPRIVAAVGLLALVPTLWYAFGRPSTGGFVAAINVVIVLAALWVAMGPIESEDGASQPLT